MWNKPALMIGGTLLFSYAIAPGEMFTGSPVDGRFVWPAYVLLCLAVQPMLARRAGTLLVVAIVGIFVLRTEILAHEWRVLDREIGILTRIFDGLPPQSKLYPVVVFPDGVDSAKRQSALKYVPCYAVLTHNAYVPTMVAVRGQQPVVARHGMPHYDWQSGVGDLHEFDFVWTYNLPSEGAGKLANIADKIAAVNKSALWKLRNAK